MEYKFEWIHASDLIITFGTLNLLHDKYLRFLQEKLGKNLKIRACWSLNFS